MTEKDECKFSKNNISKDNDQRETEKSDSVSKNWRSFSQPSHCISKESIVHAVDLTLNEEMKNLSMVDNFDSSFKELSSKPSDCLNLSLNNKPEKRDTSHRLDEPPLVTVPLHIPAYDDVVDNHDRNSVSGFPRFLNSLNSYMNTFEIPRQQQGEGDDRRPEVTQYSTNQRLLSPTEAPRCRRAAAMRSDELTRRAIGFYGTMVEKPELFEIRDAGLAGRGVFTTTAVRRNTVALRYFGEEISELEDDIRTIIYLLQGDRTFYTMSNAKTNTIYDARMAVEGMAHLCNHSHKYNSFFFPDRSGVPWLITNENIPQGVEVLVPYHCDWCNFSSPNFCFCNDTNCTGMMEYSGTQHFKDFMDLNPNFTRDVKSLMHLPKDSRQFLDGLEQIRNGLTYTSEQQKYQKLLKELASYHFEVAELVLRSDKFTTITQLVESYPQIIAEVLISTPFQSSTSSTPSSRSSLNRELHLDESAVRSRVVSRRRHHGSTPGTEDDLSAVLAAARPDAPGDFLGLPEATRTAESRGLFRESRTSPIRLTRATSNTYVISDGTVKFEENTSSDENDPEYRPGI